MRPRFLVSTLLLSVTATGSAQQQADSAAFIVRLGNDTTVIERYIRAGNQLTVEAVQRSPTTTLHRMVVDFDRTGMVSRAHYQISTPASGQPAFQRTVTFGRDSAAIETVQQGVTRQQRVAARGAIPLAGPFFSPYELAIMRGMRQARADSVPLLTGGGIVRIPVTRIGRDSVALTNQFGEPMRAHVDARGRLLHLHTPAFTTVERVRWVDFEGLVRNYAARDTTGKGLGPLSPREAFRTAVGSANIWVDYSRPAMRGRPIWGALVPYGSVWRTGANDASHFATDRALQFGSLRLEPGTYTVFLLPTADEWTLIFNRGTGISGLGRDSALDVGQVRLEKQSLDSPAELFTIDVQQRDGAGELGFAWDRIRVAAPFTVQ